VSTLQFRNPVESKSMIVRLSDYFQYHEFACPCCGVALMDDELVIALDHLRDIFGGPLTIVSGYRCDQHNLKLKGAAPNSYHKLGKAVDLNITQFNGDKLMKLIWAAMGDYTSKGIARFKGFGMGGNTFHLDVRTIPTAWTY